jgi:cytochrome c-type biogenesis protein CcmE
MLIINGLRSASQYYLTVSELEARAASLQGRPIRLSGIVDGGTIRYDPETLYIEFGLVDRVADIGKAQPLKVVYQGAKPDLLQNEAQAIVEGTLGPDGVFYAQTLLLKCPTRYEEEAARGSSR